MPPQYDEGSLLDELARLKLFVVEIHDHAAMQAPAESAGPKRVRADHVTPATSVPTEIAAQVRELRTERSKTVSAIIASALITYLSDVRSSPLVG